MEKGYERKQAKRHQRHGPIYSTVYATSLIISPPTLVSYQLTANHVTVITTSSPRSSAPGYLNVHIPSRFVSQNAPAAECIPRLPVLLAVPSAAADLSISPCCTMVLFTVKR
jgi:hypothetical protein